MRPQQLTALMTLGAAVVLALCLGISIATENYVLLIFVGTCVIVTALVVMPGYIPLYIFSLLVPFSLPIPFVWNVPFLMIGLVICGVKHWLQGGLRQRGLNDGRHAARLHFATISILMFMNWVLIRYLVKPAIPNIMGWGSNVTGFRAWLSYALCFLVLFYTGRLIGNRDGLLKTMQWIAYASAFFIILFVPVTLSGNPALANFFFGLGMYVSSFDNGMLRFVAVPIFGLFLIGLLLLPNLLTVSRTAWGLLFVLGISAIFLGGNRTSLAMAIIIMTIIPLLRGRYLQFTMIVGSLAVILLGAYFAGPRLSQVPHTGFLRAFGLVSPELSAASGGDANVEWREVRWQRGLDEIRKHPLIGVGYGGMENALVSDTQSEQDSEDMSLATGGVHNGYIACALALGIPAAVLFICILASQILMNAWRAISLRKTDRLASDVHCFVCANLLAISASAFFAADMNDPNIWFFFALGIFARQLRRQEAKSPALVPAFVRPIMPIPVG